MASSFSVPQLDRAKQIALASLAYHDGFKVLRDDLLLEACVQATQATIRLDPMDADYARKLAYLQQRARIINELSAYLLKCVEFNLQNGQKADVEEKDIENLQNQIRALLATKSRV